MRWRVVLAAATLVSALAFSACGDDSSDNGNGDATEATAPADGATGESGATGENGATGESGSIADLIAKHPSTIVRNYMKAVAGGDGEAACDLLEPDAREPDCVERIEELAAETADPVYVIGGEELSVADINGLDLSTTIIALREQIATVTIDGTNQQARLVALDPDTWRIRSIPGG